MHTFLTTTQGLVFQKEAENPGQSAIIPLRPTEPLWRQIRRMVACTMALVLLSTLGGCTAIRLAYGQAPTLAYWWIDDFVDLNDLQSSALRQDIDTFFAWHREQELPMYAERLQQWQTMVAQDTTAAQSCQQFALVRDAYLRSAERSIEPLSRLALGLDADQLKHLVRHQGKSNKKFANEWLEDGVEAQKEHLFEKTLDRYETLYGELNPVQRASIKARTQSSAYNPQRVFTERKRRQADLLASLKQAQAQPSQAMDLLRQWHARVLTSPDAGYAAYSAALIRDGCDQYASLHNTTNPKQRAHAADVLRGYEVDLRALAKRD